MTQDRIKHDDFIHDEELQTVEFITVKDILKVDLHPVTFARHNDGRLTDCDEVSDTDHPRIADYNARLNENRSATLKIVMKEGGCKRGYTMNNIQVPEMTEVIVFTNQNYDERCEYFEVHFTFENGENNSWMNLYSNFSGNRFMILVPKSADGSRLLYIDYIVNYMNTYEMNECPHCHLGFIHERWSDCDHCGGELGDNDITDLSSF